MVKADVEAIGFCDNADLQSKTRFCFRGKKVQRPTRIASTADLKSQPTQKSRPAQDQLTIGRFPLPILPALGFLLGIQILNRFHGKLEPVKGFPIFLVL